MASFPNVFAPVGAGHAAPVSHNTVEFKAGKLVRDGTTMRCARPLQALPRKSRRGKQQAAPAMAPAQLGPAPRSAEGGEGAARDAASLPPF